MTGTTHPASTEPGPWVTGAACRNHPNSDLWYADRGTPDLDKALKICRTCPVIRDCYNHAIANDERWGVWGGTQFTLRRDVPRTTHRTAAA